MIAPSDAAAAGTPRRRTPAGVRQLIASGARWWGIGVTVLVVTLVIVVTVIARARAADADTSQRSWQWLRDHGAAQVISTLNVPAAQRPQHADLVAAPFAGGYLAGALAAGSTPQRWSLRSNAVAALDGDRARLVVAADVLQGATTTHRVIAAWLQGSEHTWRLFDVAVLR